MGKRGPAATPTTQLAARGSWRANQRGSEPKPLTDLPEPPEWIDAHPMARDLWGQLGPMLVSAGLMAQPYSITLACTVEALATYITRLREAAVTPSTYDTETGCKEHPIHKSLDRARADLKRWLAAWGLSPADVASVSTAGKAAESVLDRFGLNDN